MRIKQTRTVDATEERPSYFRVLSRRDLRRHAVSVIAVFFVLPATMDNARADATDEVTSTFTRFIDAQNAHDLQTVSSILDDSPQTLWVARGKPVFGRDAIERGFAENYKGYWLLQPHLDKSKVSFLAPEVAQLFVPATISVAPAGQVASPREFLLTQMYVKRASGWKLTTIVTTPASSDSAAIVH
jgi:uncharacterized protein (TIGR02246 family)